ncbi:hypothetical protein [Kocuria sabuli]|uniref:hypothetical protein n=1 Tax=Kocuria sabuli TaxID=3071448 RepID=UPI0034D486D5
MLTARVAAAGLRVGAPSLVPVTTAFVLLGLLVLLVVTLRWMASAHVATAACWAVALGALTFPGAALLAAPVPAAVALSRVRTGDHTPAQAATGAHRRADRPGLHGRHRPGPLNPAPRPGPPCPPRRRGRATGRARVPEDGRVDGSRPPRRPDPEDPPCHHVPRPAS